MPNIRLISAAVKPAFRYEHTHRQTDTSGLEHYNRTCKLCKDEEEDLVHFLIKCKALEEERNYEILENNTNDPELKARILLFRNENIQEVSKLIRSLWECRKKLMKQVNSEDKKMENRIEEN